MNGELPLLLRNGCKSLTGDGSYRHGCPITFLDRQMVLQVLYNNIKDKTKVLTKKRVERVTTTDDGVLVQTADGSTYRGDILIGADGIHSTVRKEMWKIGNRQAPGWFPADEHNCTICRTSYPSIAAAPQ